jgi:crotonobetainyl-CoA:carnitine CoA-transferase CaiB-like acyl-CoA transferase
MPELLKQPEFSTNMARVQNRDRLVPMLEQRCVVLNELVLIICTDF